MSAAHRRCPSNTEHRRQSRARVRLLRRIAEPSLAVDAGTTTTTTTTLQRRSNDAPTPPPTTTSTTTTQTTAATSARDDASAGTSHRTGGKIGRRENGTGDLCNGSVGEWKNPGVKFVRYVGDFKCNAFVVGQHFDGHNALYIVRVCANREFTCTMNGHWPLWVRSLGGDGVTGFAGLWGACPIKVNMDIMR